MLNKVFWYYLNLRLFTAFSAIRFSVSGVHIFLLSITSAFLVVLPITSASLSVTAAPLLRMLSAIVTERETF